jgi:hypothetical protein
LSECPLPHLRFAVLFSPSDRSDPAVARLFEVGASPSRNSPTPTAPPQTPCWPAGARALAGLHLPWQDRLLPRLGPGAGQAVPRTHRQAPPTVSPTSAPLPPPCRLTALSLLRGHQSPSTKGPMNRRPSAMARRPWRPWTTSWTDSWQADIPSRPCALLVYGIELSAADTCPPLVRTTLLSSAQRA